MSDTRPNTPPTRLNDFIADQFVSDAKKIAALKARVAELEAVSSEIAPLDRNAIIEALESALRYIQHVGANHIMCGQPHPQQWIVDKLEEVIRALKNAAPEEK